MDATVPTHVEVEKYEEQDSLRVAVPAESGSRSSSTVVSSASECDQENELAIAPLNQEDDQSSQGGHVSIPDDEEYFDEFDFEDDPVIEEGGSDENDNEIGDPDIVYEHTLKHRSFFDSVKSRRRRHLRNRERGIIPALHFTGTRKTDYWKQYGVEPDEVVEDGNIHGVDTILTENEFKNLKPTERRIHINGQKFKIMHNRKSTDSLYRAICQALGFMEDHYEQIKDVINIDLHEKWDLFSHDVCHYGNKSLPTLNPSLTSPKLMMRRYRDLLEEHNYSIPEFELRAAALHYGFTYAIAELPSGHQPITIINCRDDHVLMNGTVKYIFLKTKSPANCYEFLLPIGPLKKINDGQYPLILRDVILVEHFRDSSALDELSIKERYKPPVGRVPVGFAVDHRVFLHRSTVSHDLWSLLAELMFKKLIHAPQIKNRIMDSKHNFALYYLACKAKKRYQVYGNAGMEKLAEDFSKRFSKENPRGDLEDLIQAASYFDFSYTLIGLDAGGNFFWRDYISQHDVRRENGPYLAFFVKTLKDRSIFWYALEDVGRSCPKERKLYQDVEAGDLSAWQGKFYFRYRPRQLALLSKGDKATPTPSAHRLYNVPTQVIYRASRWASKSYAKVRSGVMTSLSSAAFKTKSFVRSFLDFLRWMKTRRKVKPARHNKNVEALYVRENP